MILRGKEVVFVRKIVENKNCQADSAKRRKRHSIVV